MNARTDFWKGDFGDAYTQRSPGDVEANVVFFSKVMGDIDIRSALELGAGVGSNLRALREIYPEACLAGVEVNESAAIELAKVADQVIYNSVTELALSERWDFVFTKGLLIHIAPEDLDSVYNALNAYSRRYILVAEYHNPVPVEVAYRGHAGRLWKRDFAGELVDRYGLKVVRYGFAWKRDPHPQDDLVWTLMEKL